MAVKLRLARAGTKKRPYYHIVAASVTSPRDGRYIERVGSYNPMLPKDNEKRIVLNEERCKYWLSVGALPTDRVARFLDAVDLFKRTVRENPNKAKPKKKAVERLEAIAEKAKAAEEAANAPAEDAPAEDAPAEEAPADAPADGDGDKEAAAE